MQRIWRSCDRGQTGIRSAPAYDPATGAVVKSITYVNTANTSDFQDLPSGWSTPSGGGLHLITQFEVDGLGRTTKLTDPNGNVSYTVYNDTNYEMRVYPGWQSSTNTTTGPTQVMRHDRPGSYTETLTTTATPGVSDGWPSGTESISNLQTLSRSYTNDAGQMVRSDAYFNLSGVTYSTSAYPGTQNTNYYATDYGYDDRGQLDRIQLPTGTIQRTVRDGLLCSAWSAPGSAPMTLPPPASGTPATTPRRPTWCRSPPTSTMVAAKATATSRKPRPTLVARPMRE